MLEIGQMVAKEAEMVDGTWFNYFQNVVDPVFTDETCRNYDSLFNRMYGDFFERNLEKDEGYLLCLGAGFGMTEIPLARRGFRVIGIDNDKLVLSLLEENSRKYADGNLEARFGDVYSDFHHEYMNKGIHACCSFGLLEHFRCEDLDELIEKQFSISPLIVAMIPINTPETLKTYHAEKNPVGNIDENGIYRNFWTADCWEDDIFGALDILDRCFPTNYSRIGQIDMATYLVRKS